MQPLLSGVFVCAVRKLVNARSLMKTYYYYSITVLLLQLFYINNDVQVWVTVFQIKSYACALLFGRQDGGSGWMGVEFFWRGFYHRNAWKLEIGPREQTRTTSLPSHSGCIWADALIRLVNILIELNARTKLSVLGLSLYLSLGLWHAVCITPLSLLPLWFQRDVNSLIFVHVCGCTAR